jgi:uncharacterized membrane protein YhhN
MKTRLLFLLYLIISFAEITLVAQGNDALRMYTKPLIIPILAALYLTSTSKRVGFFKDAILLGLFFSWIGDMLLQMDGRFVPGLLSFLIAHIFYIRFFATTSSTEKSFFKLRPVMLLGVMAYLIELMYLLWPFLGVMKIPVLLYGITISTMLSAALWQYQKLENKTAVFFILGAFFFVVSDSILAINKFRNAFENAGILIMTTYIVAQLFIVEGAIRYRNQTR